MRILVQAPDFLSQRPPRRTQARALSLEPGATVGTVLRSLGIPDSEVWRVAVSGVLVGDAHELREDDRVVVMPPVGGG